MIDGRRVYSACAFMDNVFVFWGVWKDASGVWTALSYWLKFNTTSKKWNRIGGMRQTRENSACAVFEGGVVVSVGCDSNVEALNTEEPCDCWQVVVDAQHCSRWEVPQKFSCSKK